jgi:2-polyprenyl-3-methyl-5-hydroxy-6-metoxy-1,4-benzoquinol methylase
MTNETRTRARQSRQSISAGEYVLVMRARTDPHVALAAGSLAALGAELVYRKQGSTAWLLVGAAAAALGLVQAWREQERLRPVPVLALAAALPLAWLLLHLGLDVSGDKDASVVYRWQGNGLLRGDYPRSEYPLGAVLLFALEAWLGGGSTRSANALVMIPFQVALVASIWATRGRYAPWLATFVGLWPANAFYWEFKYDLVPAALLAVGLVLAWRERWALSGIVLGVGTLVKWTPSLAVVAFVVWLVAGRRFREATSHALAAAGAVALVYLPFLVWSPSEVAAAYTRQSGRTITPESVWYLLLRPFDLAHVRTHISFSAGAPRWANVAAVAIQVLALLVVFAAAVRARTSLRAATVLAACAPAVFLLTNRIFSPQFIVVLFAAWGTAAALVVRTRREQLAVGTAMGAAALANTFVYPHALPFYDVVWPLCSAVVFGAGFGLTMWLVASASRGFGAVNDSGSEVDLDETLDATQEARNYNDWLYGRARRYLGRRVLDLGAGIGKFTELAADDGCDVVALEPHARYAELLRSGVGRRPNVEVANATVGELLEASPEKFDSAICINVLEHIPDDAATVRATHDLLVPGGHLLLLVPAHPRLYGTVDRRIGHVRRYRREPLAELLRSVGFEIVTARYVNPVGALGWLVTFRLRSPKRWPRAQQRAFDALVPALRHLDRMPSPVGLSVWVVARRPLRSAAAGGGPTSA